MRTVCRCPFARQVHYNEFLRASGYPRAPPQRHSTAGNAGNKNRKPSRHDAGERSYPKQRSLSPPHESDDSAKQRRRQRDSEGAVGDGQAELDAENATLRERAKVVLVHLSEVSENTVWFSFYGQIGMRGYKCSETCCRKRTWPRFFLN